MDAGRRTGAGRAGRQRPRLRARQLRGPDHHCRREDAHAVLPAGDLRAGARLLGGVRCAVLHHLLPWCPARFTITVLQDSLQAALCTCSSVSSLLLKAAAAGPCHAAAQQHGW